MLSRFGCKDEFFKILLVPDDFNKNWVQNALLVNFTSSRNVNKITHPFSSSFYRPGPIYKNHGKWLIF